MDETVAKSPLGTAIFVESSRPAARLRKVGYLSLHYGIRRQDFLDRWRSYTAVLIERIRHEVCCRVLRPARAHRRLRRPRRAASRGGRGPADDRHSSSTSAIRRIPCGRPTANTWCSSGIAPACRRSMSRTPHPAPQRLREPRELTAAGIVAGRRVLEHRRQGADDGEGRRSLARADRWRRGDGGLDDADRSNRHRPVARRHEGRVRRAASSRSAGWRAAAAGGRGGAGAATSCGCARSPTITRRSSRARRRQGDRRHRLVA